jgi:hypothetical protein
MKSLGGRFKCFEDVNVTNAKLLTTSRPEICVSILCGDGRRFMCRDAAGLNETSDALDPPQHFNSIEFDWKIDNVAVMNEPSRFVQNHRQIV